MYDDVAMVLRWEGPLTWTLPDMVRQPLGEVQNVYDNIAMVLRWEGPLTQPLGEVQNA